MDISEASPYPVQRQTEHYEEVGLSISLCSVRTAWQPLQLS